MTVRHHRRGDKTVLQGASYGRLQSSHTPKEDTHVLPPPCDRMDGDDPDAFAPLDEAPSHRTGAVDTGDGAGTLLCADGRQGVPGGLAQPQRADRAPAVARVLLRSHRQEREAPLRPRRRALLCALAGLGRQLVAGHPIGRGPRCDHVGHALYGLGHQRRLSGLCHPGDLDGLASDRPTCLAPGVVADAAPGASGGLTVVDGDRAGRSWLVRALAVSRITRLGWHSFLRINTGGTFRPQGQVRGVSLKTLVPEPGTTWQGTGIAFKGRHRQLNCTLLACWEAGYKDPWLLLTDLPPEASAACWYGLRAWIEQGFKITKRAGWQWQRTHMTT